MKRLSLILVGIPALATACINDRDTLAFELRNVDALNRIQGETDVRKRTAAVQELALKAIGGRFERFPERYYQMRIDRLQKQDSLTAEEWDDLAVAFDRLGNIGRAIDTVLASRPHRKTDLDRYRFHANYGTFLVHRWIAAGAAKFDIKTLEQSIAQIEAALKLDPNSHFGRERVQLQLEKRWRKEKMTGEKMYDESGLKDEDWVVGLSGIAMMGLGYELPDVYLIINDFHLARQASSSLLTQFANLRAKELLDAGKKPVGVFNLSKWNPSAENNVDYARLREDGEKVHQARLAYMNERFERGEHPDTHPDFWAEWKEPKVPVLNIVPEERLEQVIGKWAPIIGIGTVALIVLLAGGKIWKRRRMV